MYFDLSTDYKNYPQSYAQRTKVEKMV